MFNWPKGNKELKKTVLNTVEVCTIIKAGAKSNVTLLKIGDIEIWFGKPTEPDVIQHVLHPPSNYPTGEEIPVDHKQQNQLSLEIDEIRLKEDRLAQMIIENPALAEQMILDGDFGDDDGESDDFD